MALWFVRKAWRRIPWKVVWAIAFWLVKKGQQRVRVKNIVGTAVRG
jgi:hypothetical protein